MTTNGTLRRWSVVGFRRVAAVDEGHPLAKARNCAQPCGSSRGGRPPLPGHSIRAGQTHPGSPRGRTGRSAIGRIARGAAGLRTAHDGLAIDRCGLPLRLCKGLTEASKLLAALRREHVSPRPAYCAGLHNERGARNRSGRRACEMSAHRDKAGAQERPAHAAPSSVCRDRPV